MTEQKEIEIRKKILKSIELENFRPRNPNETSEQFKMRLLNLTSEIFSILKSYVER